MPLVINSNTAALNSQRQLVKSGDDLSKAMERLSSGKRINTAADDAAGLAISNRQTSAIMGLNQAVRNANDGVSMIQTAEGALDETTNILQRMRELAIQAANGIYSTTDRATLDAEVQQLKAEMDRIAESTTFNGRPLLDGSVGDVILQVGSQANQTINFTIAAMDTETLGGTAGGDVVGNQFNLAALQALDGANPDLTINNQSVGDLSGATTVAEALDAINTNVSGVTVSAFTELEAAGDGTGIIRNPAVPLTISMANIDGTTSTLEIVDTGSMEELAVKINDSGLLQASLNENGRLIIVNQTGAQLTVTDNAAGVAAGITSGGGNVVQNPQLSIALTDSSQTSVDIAYTGTVTAAEIQAIGLDERAGGDITGQRIPGATAGTALAEGDLKINDIEIGAVAGNAAELTQVTEVRDQINAKSNLHGVVATIVNTDALQLNSVDGTEITIDFSDATVGLAATGLQETNNTSTQGSAIADVVIDTPEGAQAAIPIIDLALETINATRSEMGAINNRLNFTISNLMNVSENTAAARSRIVDADYAAETANLSRAQVLQQAAQAMLAQANATPQQVLQLLNS